MTTHHSKTHIYQSRLHLALTLAFVVLPVLYFLLFTNTAHISGNELGGDIIVSFVRILIAYVIAAALAWVCAVLFYRGKRSLVALPVFDVLQSFPTFAALPIAVVLLGQSDTTVITFLVLTIIWPIFFSIISSLKLLKRDWYEAVEIYGLRRGAYLKYFLGPATLTGLITGSIIGLGEGWEALVATEIIVHTQSGLGQFFQLFAANTTITAFGIGGFLLLIFSINKLVWLPLLEWSHQRTEE